MRLIALIVLVIISYNVNAQTWMYVDCNELPVNQWCYEPVGGVMAVVNPESDSSIFTINSLDSTNSWYYGESGKQFGWTQDTVVGWVTDPIQPYAENLKSEFVLTANLDHHAYALTWLYFEHRYDTDSLTDGGYVELSCDSLNWFKIWDLEQGSNPNEIITYNYGSGLLPDSTPAFTGVSYYWIETSIAIQWYIYLLQAEEYRDLTGCGEWQSAEKHYYRFVFESDSTSTGRPGWQIRHISLGSHEQHGSVAENEMKPFRLYPNPATELVTMILPEKVSKLSLATVYDMAGRQLLQQPITNTMDVSSLDIGNYLIVVQAENESYRALLVKE